MYYVPNTQTHFTFTFTCPAAHYGQYGGKCKTVKSVEGMTNPLKVSNILVKYITEDTDRFKRMQYGRHDWVGSPGAQHHSSANPIFLSTHIHPLKHPAGAYGIEGY